jgi:hypothetical protein
MYGSEDPDANVPKCDGPGTMVFMYHLEFIFHRVVSLRRHVRQGPDRADQRE